MFSVDSLLVIIELIFELGFDYFAFNFCLIDLILIAILVAQFLFGGILLLAIKMSPPTTALLKQDYFCLFFLLFIACLCM